MKIKLIRRIRYTSQEQACIERIIMGEMVSGDDVAGHVIGTEIRRQTAIVCDAMARKAVPPANERPKKEDDRPFDFMDETAPPPSTSPYKRSKT